MHQRPIVWRLGAAGCWNLGTDILPALVWSIKLFQPASWTSPGRCHIKENHIHIFRCGNDIQVIPGAPSEFYWDRNRITIQTDTVGFLVEFGSLIAIEFWSIYPVSVLSKPVDGVKWIGWDASKENIKPKERPHLSSSILFSISIHDYWFPFIPYSTSPNLFSNSPIVERQTSLPRLIPIAEWLQLLIMLVCIHGKGLNIQNPSVKTS